MNDVQWSYLVGWNGTNPPSLMRMPNDTMYLIGHIIASWGILEQELDTLIWAVRTTLKDDETVGKEFKRRRAYLKDLWARFVGGNSELLDEWHTLDSEIDQGKKLRDDLAHRRAFPGIDEKGGFICFQTDSKTRPWSKRYRDHDMEEANLAISRATGRLYRLTWRDQDRLPFSFLSRSLLQRLPDTGHLRSPTPQKPPFRQRS